MLYGEIIFGIVSLLLVHHSVSQVNSGLVSKLIFNQASNNIVPDVSGNNNVGTLMNGATVSGGFLTLNGNNQYVQLPANIFAGLSAVSVTLWIRVHSAVGWSRIWDFGSGTGTYLMITPYPLGQNMLACYAKVNSGNDNINNANGSLPLNQWAHVAMTQDSLGNMKMYLNGALIGTIVDAVQVSQLQSTTQNWIGRSQYNDPYLNADINDFRIYSIALGQSDIMTLANWRASDCSSVGVQWFFATYSWNVKANFSSDRITASLNANDNCGTDIMCGLGLTPSTWSIYGGWGITSQQVVFSYQILSTGGQGVRMGGGACSSYQIIGRSTDTNGNCVEGDHYLGALFGANRAMIAKAAPSFSMIGAGQTAGTWTVAIDWTTSSSGSSPSMSLYNTQGGQTQLAWTALNVPLGIASNIAPIISLTYPGDSIATVPNPIGKVSVTDCFAAGRQWYFSPIAGQYASLSADRMSASLTNSSNCGFGVLCALPIVPASNALFFSCGKPKLAFSYQILTSKTSTGEMIGGGACGSGVDFGQGPDKRNCAQIDHGWNELLGAQNTLLSPPPSQQLNFLTGNTYTVVIDGTINSTAPSISLFVNGSTLLWFVQGVSLNGNDFANWLPFISMFYLGDSVRLVPLVTPAQIPNCAAPGLQWYYLPTTQGSLSPNSTYIAVDTTNNCGYGQFCAFGIAPISSATGPSSYVCGSSILAFSFQVSSSKYWGYNVGGGACASANSIQPNFLNGNCSYGSQYSAAYFGPGNTQIGFSGSNWMIPSNPGNTFTYVIDGSANPNAPAISLYANGTSLIFTNSKISMGGNSMSLWAPIIALYYYGDAISLVPNPQSLASQSVADCSVSSLQWYYTSNAGHFAALSSSNTVASLTSSANCGANVTCALPLAPYSSSNSALYFLCSTTRLAFSYQLTSTSNNGLGLGGGLCANLGSVANAPQNSSNCVIVDHANNRLVGLNNVTLSTNNWGYPLPANYIVWTVLVDGSLNPQAPNIMLLAEGWRLIWTATNVQLGSPFTNWVPMVTESTLNDVITLVPNPKISDNFTNWAVFTSSGTLTVPAGVYSVRVLGIGGGAPGTYGNTGTAGGAAAITVVTVSVTPGANVQVTVGAGGDPGSNPSRASTNGMASSFGSISFPGCPQKQNFGGYSWPLYFLLYNKFTIGQTGIGRTFTGAGGIGGVLMNGNGPSGGISQSAVNPSINLYLYANDGGQGYGAGGGCGGSLTGGGGASGLVYVEWSPPSAPYTFFFMNGNNSFTAPTNVASGRVLMIGGGGGGAAGLGGAGGSGNFVFQTVTWTPGASYTITLGAGGNGSVSGGAATNGGTTSIGTLVSVAGGKAGLAGGVGGAGGSGGGGGGSGCKPGGGGGTNGGNGGTCGSVAGGAGQGGTSLSAYISQLKQGRSLFVPGIGGWPGYPATGAATGGGGLGFVDNWTAGNSGQNAQYNYGQGFGGGGGAGGMSGTTAGNGGNGMNGFVYIEW